MASFIGGTISIILFTLFAPPLADFALKFGQPEEFTLMGLAFSTFVGLGGDDIIKTLFCIFIGLAMSAVGLDVISGRPRLIQTVRAFGYALQKMTEQEARSTWALLDEMLAVDADGAEAGGQLAG